jgi:hypothetical protein
MRLHLRPLGVGQYESFHPKLESQPAIRWNPESQQALEQDRKVRRRTPPSPRHPRLLEKPCAPTRRVSSFLAADNSKHLRRAVLLWKPASVEAISNLKGLSRGALMRYAFKAADFGASIVSTAMCARAFWRHFYNDVAHQLQRTKLPLVKNSPSLIPAKVVKLHTRRRPF